MSSSLSAMPFSRQYSSFRMAGVSNITTATGSYLPARGSGNNPILHGGISQATRHSSETVNRRIGNLARQSSNNWINNSSSSAAFPAIRQQKISSQQQLQQEPSTERPVTTVVVSKQPHIKRCAVHRTAAGSATKKIGEPIGDTPLLQSPRIIARSAQIVEPNVWNRRLTTSNFCTMTNSAASQPHYAGNRLMQASLASRKSPGSSGTSVESIVPKYTIPLGAADGGSAGGVGGSETTAAQKRTYNAHKPQMRVVSSRTLTNTTGRVGTVAKKAIRPTASQNADLEVAKVLHHHNMQMIDMLNNNHVQQQTNRAGRVIRENNENHQPAASTAVAPNSGQKLSGPKKGSAIPQRLPLADRDQPTDSNRRLLLGECFSSKFPNGLPFEQEFYYRRAVQDSDTGEPINEIKQDAEKQEENKHEELRHSDENQRFRKSKKPALSRRQVGHGGGGVTLAGRRVAMTQQELLHRSRSVSSSDDATSPATITTLTGERRSVSAIEREHNYEDALYVDFTKVHDPQSKDCLREDEPVDNAQTSVVQYRNIDHSSYYYKFESISSHRKDSPHRKLLQRRSDDVGIIGERQEIMRSRCQRSRLGLNWVGACSPDANGNTEREYNDDDEERHQFHDNAQQIEEFEENEEEEGEKSTVYVAVATWVPKCNRLPNENSEKNNTICLTLATNGNYEYIDQQPQQQRQQQPTRMAVAATTNRMGLPVKTPSNYDQL
uniref:Uncharacterized protein n=1 Tax=Anopheles culicifacies TaxID=139723 RepID=A0A182MD38_9DIPT